MLHFVKGVEVAYVELQPVVVQSDKKGNPTVTPWGSIEYKFEVDDLFPAPFWTARRGQVVLIDTSWIQIDPDDDQSPRELAIKSVVDIVQG